MAIEFEVTDKESRIIYLAVNKPFLTKELVGQRLIQCALAILWVEVAR
ncbi:MAG: hypothetical protein RLZZ630_576 [Bacteroidota bacterium]|jgi:hypothetical protein